MTIKLYGFPQGFTTIPAIVLREKGVDFDFVYLDLLGKREQMTPEHFARNPWGKVPVIVGVFSSNSSSLQVPP
jgi:glutathione S-transferase